MMSDNVRISLATIREGEQHLRTCFSVGQAEVIACMANEVGVDFIEVGFPAASRLCERRAAHLCALPLRAQTVAMARSDERDVNAALQCGADWVSVVVHLANQAPVEEPMSLVHLCEQLERISDLVHGANRKLKVAVEDAFRMDSGRVVQFVGAAHSLADRIGCADTSGFALPGEVAGLICRLREITDASIEVHCHNDFGLALANTLAAVEAGASVAAASALGLGERVGITSLAQLVSVLSVRYGFEGRWDLNAAVRLEHVVSEFSGVPIPSTAPIVGAGAFVHKAGLHQHQVLQDPTLCEPADPSLWGLRRAFIYSHLASRKAVECLLVELGVDEGARPQAADRLWQLLKKDGCIALSRSDVLALLRAWNVLP